MTIDAHQHFWIYDSAQYPWMPPGWPIRRNMLPVDLEPLLDTHGLTHSIAVQARQSLEESHWLLKLADQHHSIAGVVGWVELRSERVEEQLVPLARHPAFVGVRHVVQDEPDDAFMLRPDFQRGISKLKQFNLTYDILIFPKQLPAAIKLVNNFPYQIFILDHIAKPIIRNHDKSQFSLWRKQMFELAAHQNVFCKISGMVTEADWKNRKPSDFEPYFDTVFEAFGPKRLMYGSDWPVCLLAGTYHEVFQLVANYIEQLPANQHDDVMGETAARAYGLQPECN